MKILSVSRPLSVFTEKQTDDAIHVFAQFYVDGDAGRHKENVFCIRENVANPFISTIYLLNERIYSPAELGVHSAKIVQVVIGKRMMYKDVFDYVQTQKIQGYICILNADIFLDATIDKLRYSDLASTETKQMLALLRYEYNPAKPVADAKLFGPRYDSQDTWIYHSNNPLPGECMKMFGIQLGKPGCDNKFVYLAQVAGYDVINDPLTIRTYHYHTSQVRKYTRDDVIGVPWGAIIPANMGKTPVADSLGLQISRMDSTRFDDNTLLYDYILKKLGEKQAFVIPRVSTIETDFACYARMLTTTQDARLREQIKTGFFKNQRPYSVLKNNAGIKVSSLSSVVDYSNQYLAAFENCEIYGAWDKNGHVYPCVSTAQDFIETSVCSKKRMFWGFAFDIFHYIYHPTPWTHALRGSRVLIISAFEDSIREKLPVLDKIYGRDLFPDCTFLTLKPPQTQGAEDSPEFTEVLSAFYKKLDALKGQYDVALVSCGGYGSLVVAHIYASGTPAIYVGGVLQMYFGILGSRWLRERPDIVRAFLNPHWSRPKESEKPANYKAIEGSCYW